MTIELDWQEGDEAPAIRWDEMAETASRPRQLAAQAITGDERPDTRPARRVRRVLLLVGFLVVAMAASAILLLSNRGSSQARRDVEATAQAVLQASRERNVADLASLVHPDVPAFASQTLAGATAAEAPILPDTVRVRSVDMLGDRAVAELEESMADGSLQRRLAFFRREEGQWLLAPAWLEAFGPERQTASTHFRITYRERDEALLDDLINVAEGSFVALCGELRCREDGRGLSLRLAYATPALVRSGSGELTMPSPWLLGVDAAGRAGPAWNAELVGRLAAWLAQRQVSGASPGLLDAVSVWAVAGLTGPEASRSPVLPSLVEASLPPLEVAWSQVTGPDGQAQPLAVAQIATMLAYAQERAGSDAVGQLLESLDRHGQLGGLAPVLQDALGVDLGDFEAGWSAWLLENPAAPAGTESG